MQPIEGFLPKDFKAHLNESEAIKDEGDDHKRSQLDKLLYNTTRRLLIISQIFLCAPPGVHKPKTVVPTTQERLFFRLFLWWCLGLYLLLCLCVYDEYTSSNAELPTVQKPLYFSEYLVYMVHLLEIILSRYMEREKFWSFHKFITKFDRKLLELKLPINYLKLRAFINIHLCLILFHLVFTVIIDYFYTKGIWLNFFRTNTVYVLPNIIIQISLVHYYALLFMIDKHSEKLYHLLEMLQLKSPDIDVWILRSQLHVLRNLYARLEQFTRDVNDAFSYTIVLVYFGSFINICVNIFLLYKAFNAWSQSDLATTIYAAAWVCMHTAKMTLILYYNQRIQDKKLKASVFLSTFRYEKVVVEPTVRLFVLQLMSDTRSNVICGLAALNMNFITSLLVAISTLFIFLVQYDITFEALSKTTNSAKPQVEHL